MQLRSFLIASGLSCFFYATVFLFIAHRPLTAGVMRDIHRHKMAYLASLGSPKIVVLAGSNGRFSHSCSVIEKKTGFGCANMSVAAGMSMSFQFDMIRQYLRTGDLVYLPLEFGKLSEPRNVAMAGSEVPYLMAFNRQYLFGVGPERLLRAVFYHDFKALLSNVGETVFSALGMQKRYSVDSLTAQGDESGHTGLIADKYRDYIAGLRWDAPTPESVCSHCGGARAVVEFMKWASDNGVTVVGGLPTTFADVPIPRDVVAALKRFYEDAGHRFLVLDNQSQYPRAYFFDANYHLREEFQVEHSQRLAERLVSFVSSSAQ